MTDLPATPPIESVDARVSSERAWKIAQLAAVLASSIEPRERISSGFRSEPQIASVSLDPLYAGALKRAESLLDWAEGNWGPVHAYRLFEESEILTEEQILNVFKEVEWPDLKSKQPVMDLMAESRTYFEDELGLHERIEDLGSSPAILNLLRDLDAAITAVLRQWLRKQGEIDAYCSSVKTGMLGILKKRVTRLRAQLPKASISTILNAIDTATSACEADGKADIESVRQFTEELKVDFEAQTRDLFPSGGTLERFIEQIHRDRFLAWCFPDPPKNSRAEKVYRPYEIFLHCVKRNWFSDKLVIDARSLELRATLGPLADLRQPYPEVFLETISEEITAAHG